MTSEPDGPSMRLLRIFRFESYRWRMTSTPHVTSGASAPETSERLVELLRNTSTLTLGDETVPLTAEARSALSRVFELLASGLPVVVTTASEMLTTQEAADVIGVSRPTLVKLLHSGEIKYEQPGVHRRVSRAAIEDFLRAREERRRIGLEALARDFDPDQPDEYVSTR